MILAIYCAGGFGRELLDASRALNRSTNTWEDIIFVDDVTEEKVIYDANVLRFDEVEQYRGNVEFLIANGEPAYREMLYNKVKNAGYPLGRFISPWASVGSGTTIGEGCILYDCCITVGVHIGDNTYVSSKVVVGHDVKIGSHSILSCGSFYGGGITVGDRCYIAPGAYLQDRIVVGDDAIVGMGSIVVRNVKPEKIVFGNPARVIGDNDERRVWGSRNK